MLGLGTGPSGLGVGQKLEVPCPGRGCGLPVDNSEHFCTILLNVMDLWRFRDPEGMGLQDGRFAWGDSSPCSASARGAGLRFKWGTISCSCTRLF